jgi:hypothetical protein
VKFTITIEVDASLDPDGAVRGAQGLHSHDVRDLIEAQYPEERRRKMAAHATRCRLDEGLVRVDGGSGWRPHMSYVRFARSTAKYHVLLGASGEIRYRRDNGYRAGERDRFHYDRIREEDLAALNGEAPEPKRRARKAAAR